MEFITLELRPRLQSCNVFILLKTNSDMKKLQIKLSKESISLTGNIMTEFLLPSVKIIPNSLSMLNIHGNWVCFRLQTEPLDSVFGSFKTEIINLKSQINVSTDRIGNEECLFKSSKCTILCTCCKNVISKTIEFKRVLPFPDIDYDTSDWFCCKGHNNDVSMTLCPKEFDLLYGLFFLVLHKNVFTENLQINKKIVTCRRCLHHLGTIQTNDSFKIWNCSVDFKLSNHSLIVKVASNPLHDFFLILKNSLNGTIGEEVILKSLESNLTHYVFIKPMDWNLNLITEPKQDCCNNVISLIQTGATKVLYKYGTDETIVSSNFSMIKDWEVSLAVIETGLKYLLSSTERFPQTYRTAADYYIGHIHLDKFTN